MDTLADIIVLEQTNYPSLSDRVQSTFIDTVLIIILMFIFSSVLSNYENVPDWVRIALFASVFVVYEPICTTFGATLGNYIKGIRLRRYSNISRRINFFLALIRYIVKISLGWLSFITIHSSKKKRAIHDIIAGSIMIKL